MSDPDLPDPDAVEPKVADGPAERERESAETDETRYERELEAEAARQREAAERLRADELPEPADEG